MQGTGFRDAASVVFAICAVVLCSAPSAWPADTVLYDFNGLAAAPYSTLISDQYGNLYGTTLYGGDYNCNADSGCGTVFVLCAPNVPGNSDLYPCTTGNPLWEEHELHNFAGGKDGAYPFGSVLFLGAGSRGAFTLYGTTYYGGQSQCNDGVELGCGTVFELCAPHNDGGCGGANKWTERVVHSFTGGKKDGSYPFAGVITDGSGSLFGTTVYGGGKGNCKIEMENANDYCGTVFMLKGGRPWTFRETIFHRFTGARPACTPYVPAGCDGANPYAGLCCNTQYGVSYFYGTTFTGGDPNAQVGTMFSVKNATPFVETELYNFRASSGEDGANPTADVILYPKYFGCSTIICLVGSASAGGPYNGGIVFELKQNGPPWTEQVLYPFCLKGCGDGAVPFAGLIVDADGNLYGTTTQGGNLQNCGGVGCGTVFDLEPRNGRGYWPERVLNSFAGSLADGANSYAGVTFGPPPEVYGTTIEGGSNGAGIAYSVP